MAPLYNGGILRVMHLINSELCNVEVGSLLHL